jgi:hypothetical protein
MPHNTVAMASSAIARLGALRFVLHRRITASKRITPLAKSRWNSLLPVAPFFVMLTVLTHNRQQLAVVLGCKTQTKRIAFPS